MADLDGFERHHPSQLSTIDDAQEKSFPGLRNMLKRYYINALNISSSRAAKLLQKHPKVVIWDRLYDEKTSLLMEMVYRRSGKKSKNERASCFFSEYFRDDSHLTRVSYEKAIGFLEHCIDGYVHILVVAAWISSGLHTRSQGQVYAKCGRRSAFLFRSVTVESVACMSNPIGVVEAEVLSRNRRQPRRTYFIDDMREQHGLLTGEPWNSE